MARSRGSDEIRNLLQGLIFGCPLENEKGNCVIGRVRNLSPDERLKWVDGLSNDQCLELFLEHQDCLIRCEEELGLRGGD